MREGGIQYLYEGGAAVYWQAWEPHNLAAHWPFKEPIVHVDQQDAVLHVTFK